MVSLCDVIYDLSLGRCVLKVYVYDPRETPRVHFSLGETVRIKEISPTFKDRY